jgi:hypothetical protein
MAERKALMLYHSHIENLEDLPDDLRGILVLALLRYSKTGEIATLQPELRYVFNFMRAEVDRDKEKYEKTCAGRSESGKRGGRQKKANAFDEKQSEAKKANADAKADAEEEIPPLPPTGGNPPDLMQRRFNALWDAYPKKVGKGAALTALKKRKPNEQLFKQIMEAVSTAKKNAWFMRDKGQYIPNLSTWLNQTRWEDELPEGDTSDGRTNQADPGAYNDDDIPF